MRTRSGAERGMSLVEVVVAVVILAIVSTAILGVILRTQSAGVSNRSRITASSLAAREIDMVRDEFSRSNAAPLAIARLGTQTNPHPLDGQTAGNPLVVNNTAYVVVRSVAWNITRDGASACSGGSLVVYPTLGITVSVTWPNMGSVKPVVSTESLAPAKGSGIPGTDSFIAVSVVDSLGAANVGRAVTVAGGGETKFGTTDASGCAVVQVSPAVGLGTTYTAQATDPGYVDISGTTGPTKGVGTVSQGQLNNGVKFAYDREGTLHLNLVDEAGVPLTLAEAPVGQGTLVASDSSGTSGSSLWTVGGLMTEVKHLWPTRYHAFLGTTAPAVFDTFALAAGSTMDLPVKVAMVSTTFTNLPVGTTSVIAVPGAASACPASGFRQHAVTDLAEFRLLPGVWSFFATGATFDCSPGPASQSLTAGSPAAVTWGQTTLKVTSAPAGSLWAVNLSKVPGATLTTCPGTAYAGAAVAVSGARDAAMAIPAGSWYVYVTDGAATGACLGVPVNLYSDKLDYGVANTLIWVVPSPILTVTGVASGQNVTFSTAVATACSTSSFTPGGTIQVAGPAVSDNSSLSTTVSRPPSGTQTWYAYGWNQQGAAKCANAGTFVVGPSTVSLTKAVGSTGPVGP